MDLRIFRPIRTTAALPIGVNGRQVTVRLNQPTQSVYAARVNDRPAVIVELISNVDVVVELPVGVDVSTFDLCRYSIAVDVTFGAQSPTPLAQAVGFGPTVQLVTGREEQLQRAQRLLLRIPGTDPLQRQSGAGLLSLLSVPIASTNQAAQLVAACCDRYNSQVLRASVGLPTCALAAIALERANVMRSKYGIELNLSAGKEQAILASLRWTFPSGDSAMSAAVV